MQEAECHRRESRYVNQWTKRTTHQMILVDQKLANWMLSELLSNSEYFTHTLLVGHILCGSDRSWSRVNCAADQEFSCKPIELCCVAIMQPGCTVLPTKFMDCLGLKLTVARIVGHNVGDIYCGPQCGWKENV